MVEIKFLPWTHEIPPQLVTTALGLRYHDGAVWVTNSAFYLNHVMRDKFRSHFQIKKSQLQLQLHKIV